MADSARAYIPTGNVASELTILSPSNGALVNSTSIPVSWAFLATQDQYRIQIYDDAAGDTLHFDSQWQTSAIQSATIVVSDLVSNTVYYIRVFAHGTLGETNESAIESFFFALPASVDIIGLRADPLPICNPTPFDNPSIQVSWTRPVPTETFLAYEIRRRKRGDTAWTAIIRITSLATTRYLDANVQPGQEYEYVVVFYGDDATPVTKVSAEQVTPARATTVFDWIYIHEVGNEQTEFARINALEGTVEQKLDIATAIAWGNRRPTAFVGEAMSATISLPSLELWRRHPQEWMKLVRMFSRQSTNGTILCVRFGMDREIYFVSLMQLSKGLLERSYTPQLNLQEVEYDEDIGLYVHTPGAAA